MKKMYKKPETEKVNLEPKEVNMNTTLKTSNGAHNDMDA